MPEKPGKSRLTVVPQAAASALDPPRKLGNAGLSLWHQVQADFAVDDAGGVELLTQCALLADRLADITARIQTDGLTTRSKNGGLREHPLLKAEIATRALLIRSLARLGVLDQDLRPGPGRPPKSFGWRGDD